MDICLDTEPRKTKHNQRKIVRPARHALPKGYFPSPRPPRGAFSQVAIGLAIGIPAAIGAGKLMTQQLFSVRPWDPVMLASATLALGLAALLASALPAWRAAGVEPMVALRNE